MHHEEQLLRVCLEPVAVRQLCDPILRQLREAEAAAEQCTAEGAIRVGISTRSDHAFAQGLQPQVQECIRMQCDVQQFEQ